MDVETLTYRIEVEGADKARREMSDTSDHVTGKAKAGADGIEEGSRRGVGALSKITGALGPIGGVIGGAFAVGQVAGFGKEMYGLGQELDVYNKKADTVFEGGSELVKAWADQNNEAMGLSKEKLTGLAAGFGDLLKPMGFTAEQAGKMSTEVVGLSGALSAWSGGQTSAAEVSDILAKAMLGETDGLKQLGISISQDEVNTRLARDGKEKLTGAELAQAKAIATQQLIMEKSTDAQKAWADGSMDGIKNSNTLTATFEQLKATLAEKLMPIFQRVTGWIVAEAVPFIGRLFESGKQLWNEWAPAIGDAITTIWARAQPVFDALRAAWDFVVGLFTQGADDIGNKSSWLGETVDKLGAMFSAAFGAVQAIVSTVVDVVLGIWSRFGDTILDHLRQTWDNVKQIFGGVVDMLTGVFNLIKSVLTGKWGEAWEAVKQILSGAWDVVTGLLAEVWNRISFVFTVIGRTMQDLWNWAWDGIKGAFEGVWGWITASPAGSARPSPARGTCSATDSPSPSRGCGASGTSSTDGSPASPARSVPPSAGSGTGSKTLSNRRLTGSSTSGTGSASPSRASTSPASARSAATRSRRRTSLASPRAARSSPTAPAARSCKWPRPAEMSSSPVAAPSSPCRKDGRTTGSVAGRRSPPAPSSSPSRTPTPAPSSTSSNGGPTRTGPSR